MITSLISALLAASVTLHPASLPAGPHPEGPHVDGSTLHDGAMRMTFSAPNVSYLGSLGDRYVVLLSNADGSDARLQWIRPNEKKRVLLRGEATYDAVVSGDGEHVLVTPKVTKQSTTVRVLSTATGKEVASRKFPGSVSILDADAGRAVLGSWSPNRTIRWSYDGVDKVSTINKRAGYFADITADRLASYTGDPYSGGCSVLSTLDSSRLSRSCDERVAAVSPSGDSVASIPILTDGLGATKVKTRTASGSLLDTYQAPAYFGTIRWESDTALLMDTYAKHRWATVRCDGADCERASKLRRIPAH